jgi:hypothetical protein
LLFAFIDRLSMSRRSSGIVLALTSLNPALISASIQATNDAFVILFTTLALVGGYRFLRDYRQPAFVAMTSGVVLACLSKGNGLVAAIAVSLVFVAATWRPVVARTATVSFAAVFVLVVGTLVPTVGGYVSRHRVMGSAFAINQEPLEAPDFLLESAHRRPGITSIVSGFLTFPLGSMLETPLLEIPYPRADGPDYPRHRMSMWSLLYGTGNSVQYAYYPVAWRAPQATAEWLVRSVVVLALLPTIALAVGVVRGAAQLVRQVFAAVRPMDWHGDLLLALSAVGYLGFVALYGSRYRDFATMKAMFVCPGAVAYLVSFARELDGAGRRTPGWLKTSVATSAVLLCAAYAADISVLVSGLLSSMLEEAG